MKFRCTICGGQYDQRGLRLHQVNCRARVAPNMISGEQVYGLFCSSISYIIMAVLAYTALQPLISVFSRVWGILSVIMLVIQKVFGTFTLTDSTPEDFAQNLASKIVKGASKFVDV